MSAIITILVLLIVLFTVLGLYSYIKGTTVYVAVLILSGETIYNEYGKDITILGVFRKKEQAEARIYQENNGMGYERRSAVVECKVGESMSMGAE